MREFVQALWNWKNLEKPLYFCPFWMPTTWEVSLARKYFCKTPSQNPVFPAISEGVLSLSMQLDKFIIIHLLHSSPPEPGGRAPWPFSTWATNTSLQCRFATGKATTAGTGQWYFSKELGGSAGVRLPWTWFAIGRQMNPKRTGARANRCAKILILKGKSNEKQKRNLHHRRWPCSSWLHSQWAWLIIQKERQLLRQYLSFAYDIGIWP